MKKTEWYRGYQKPVRVGVYERDYGDDGINYSYFDGDNFHYWWTHKEFALKAKPISPWQNLPWRGITKGSK